MNDAQRPIAALHRANDNPEGHDVGELFEADVLTLHLAPDRMRALLTAGHLCLEAEIGQLFRQAATDPLDGVAALSLQEVQPRDDGGAGVRVQLLEDDVLQFLLPVADADPFRQGNVNVHRLARDAAALFVGLDEMQRTHVVQPVGQLHDQNADVLRHREDELAKILRLLGPVGLQLQLRELGDPVDQGGDFLSEGFANLRDRDGGILHRIVQQAGDDGGAVEALLAENARDLDRMGKIRVAAGPLLGAVGLYGEDIGAVQRAFIRTGLIGFHPFHQLVLAHHGAATPLSV